MPRKGRFGYDPDNTTADGHYVVGKGRPPEHGKFRTGDGRPRGRRLKGTKNLATDLKEEFRSSVSVSVGGLSRKVSRQRAIFMRLADNASKGQTSAIALMIDYHERFVAPLLEREEQEKRRAKKRDYSCLTRTELRVLVYILGKVEGHEETASDIVGVIPIYRPGK